LLGPGPYDKSYREAGLETEIDFVALSAQNERRALSAELSSLLGTELGGPDRIRALEVTTRDSEAARRAAALRAGLVSEQDVAAVESMGKTLDDIDTAPESVDVGSLADAL